MYLINEYMMMMMMNNTVENDFFGFPKVKWLQYTGKVGKYTSYQCKTFSVFNTPKIIKIG